MFIWSVWSVWLFWLNETNQKNQINQINQINPRQVPSGYERNGTQVPMEGAAFCSRKESATVVIRVNLSCSFGLFGLSCLFG